jgi:hypothetical protein
VWEGCIDFHVIDKDYTKKFKDKKIKVTLLLIFF